MRVGFFDSGAGGLTVTKSLIKTPLFDEIIYYGDTARVPYGTKDANTIIRYGLEAIEFFNNFDIDILITACNTVSAYALASMRAKAKYPVYGVLKPGIWALKQKIEDRDSTILIIATKATINSKRYQNALINLGYKNIIARQTGMLVPVVEEGILSGPILQEMLKYYFQDIDKEPDAIILGCTHFPLIANEISRYFNNKPILIHSGEAIVEYLKSKGYQEISQEPKLNIYASDNVKNLRAIAKEWLELKD
jgi:glutamate racemase